MNIDKSVFRAYDIRGVVGDAFNAALVERVGQALGTLSIEKGVDQCVVARDGRVSGAELSAALIKGLVSTGVDVVDIGRVPTPVLYFATYHLNIKSGVMVTGSHNPADYNGLKMVVAGQTLSGEMIEDLYQRVCAGHFIQGKGQVTQKNVVDAYIERITSDIKLSRPMKIVIDSGNGIAGDVAPQLFTALGCEVISLFDEVDGTFPNHHPDPTILENLTDLNKAVKESGAELGLAFDGDADRLGVVTAEGDIVWPDRQMMLYAIDALSRHPGGEVIYDVKCSRYLAEVIKQSGGEPVMWKTGHSFMKQKLHDNQALLAGEMSGHIFFRERWYGFDDGMYTGCRLLEILSKASESATTVLNALPNAISTPELKLPVEEAHKFELMDQFVAQAAFEDADIYTIDGVRVEFADGWGLVRPSNTSPYLILRFEADDEEAMCAIQEQFRTQLLAVNKQFELPF